MIEVRDAQDNLICVADTVQEAFDLIERFNKEDGKENEYYVHKTA